MTIGFLARLFGLLAIVTACAPMSATQDFDVVKLDIHERLSDAITKAGFSHRIISDRNPSVHVDSIHLRIPLDGMKRRHEGVERVLAGLARVCASPDYRGLPISIVVATVDGEDGKYLRSILDHELSGSQNVAIRIVVGTSEGIMIAVSHPLLPRTP